MNLMNRFDEDIYAQAWQSTSYRFLPMWIPPVAAGLISIYLARDEPVVTTALLTFFLATLFTLFGIIYNLYVVLCVHEKCEAIVQHGDAIEERLHLRPVKRRRSRSE